MIRGEINFKNRLKIMGNSRNNSSLSIPAHELRAHFGRVHPFGIRVQIEWFQFRDSPNKTDLSVNVSTKF